MDHNGTGGWWVGGLEQIQCSAQTQAEQQADKGHCKVSFESDTYAQK